ncbi:hypothetical protein D3C78_1903890 [compost metagenome]
MCPHLITQAFGDSAYRKLGATVNGAARAKYLQTGDGGDIDKVTALLLLKHR